MLFIFYLSQLFFFPFSYFSAYFCIEYFLLLHFISFVGLLATTLILVVVALAFIVYIFNYSVLSSDIVSVYIKEP